MYRILVSAFGREGFIHVRKCRQLGMQVQVLDCLDRYRTRLTRWYGNDVLRVAGRRSDVRETVSQAQFDVAIVHEDADFVHAALITQSLREAGVGRIIVITADGAKRAAYRRCGANRVIVAQTAEEAWMSLYRFLPSSFQSA